MLVIQVLKTFTHDCILAHIFKNYSVTVYIAHFLLYIFTNVSRDSVTRARVARVIQKS